MAKQTFSSFSDMGRALLPEERLKQYASLPYDEFIDALDNDPEATLALFDPAEIAVRCAGFHQREHRNDGGHDALAHSGQKVATPVTSSEEPAGHGTRTNGPGGSTRAPSDTVTPAGHGKCSNLAPEKTTRRPPNPPRKLTDAMPKLVRREIERYWCKSLNKPWSRITYGEMRELAKNGGIAARLLKAGVAADHMEAKDWVSDEEFLAALSERH